MNKGKLYSTKFRSVFIIYIFTGNKDNSLFTVSPWQQPFPEAEPREIVVAISKFVAGKQVRVIGLWIQFTGEEILDWTRGKSSTAGE